ncbi:MAG: hypothetical protein ACI9TH_002690 [Kiritimatiellia bacterium]|jgi:hypothetical protein
MMMHCVYFWINDEVTPEQEADFQVALAELKQIGLIKQAHSGLSAPTAEREVTDHTFHTNLILFFETQADHDAYQVHPDHDAFVARCKHLWSKVIVYDTQL